MFRRKSDSRIGLDIGPTSVKLIELSQRDGRLTLESCGIEPVPPRAALETHAHTSGTHISDAEGVGEAIKRLARRTRPKTKSAAVAIGGPAAFTKVIRMDASLSDEEMEGEIALQAADQLPYPFDTAAIDFEVLHLSESDPSQVEVLLAACRREDAELLEAAVSAGGLRARALDVEPFAMARAFELLQPTVAGVSDVAIFDIGENSTTLSVLADDNMVHARTATFGGNALTEEIQRHYGISAPEAELAQRRGEVVDETILSEFRNAVLEQMTRSLQFFYSAHPSGHVDRVFLAGGVAAMPTLADEAARTLGMPVVAADPFANVILPADAPAPTPDLAPDLTKDAPAFMLACGLALRELEP